MSHGTRPILAIDTAPDHITGSRRPSLSVPRGAVNGDVGEVPLPAQPPMMPEMSPKTASSTSQSFTLLFLSTSLSRVDELCLCNRLCFLRAVEIQLKSCFQSLPC